MCVCASVLANFPAFSLSDIDYYLLERIFLYVLFFSLYFLIHFCVQFSLPGVVVVIIRRWSFLLEKQLAGRKKSKWVGGFSPTNSAFCGLSFGFVSVERVGKIKKNIREGIYIFLILPRKVLFPSFFFLEILDEEVRGRGEGSTL